MQVYSRLQDRRHTIGKDGMFLATRYSSDDNQGKCLLFVEFNLHSSSCRGDNKKVECQKLLIFE